MTQQIDNYTNLSELTAGDSDARGFSVTAKDRYIIDLSKDKGTRL